MASSKKNYFYNLTLTAINLLFPIISFPYASRILGPYGIGKTQFILTFAQYFALIAALGIPVYGIREIAKVKNSPDALSKTFSELFIIYFCSSAILGLCYLIIVSNFPTLKNDHSLYVSASLIVFIGFSSIDWFYAGIQEFKIIAIRSTIIKVLSLICLFIFVKSRDDLFIFFLISLGTLLGNNIINSVAVWKRVKLITKGLNFIIHRRPLLLVFGTTLASSMYTLFDVLILGFLADENAVGYYVAGVKLVKVSIPIVTSMGIVLMPKIVSQLHQKSISEFYVLIRKSYEFVVFLSIPICFGLFLLAKEFILLFSGQEFLVATNSMKILSSLPFIIGMGYLLGIQILTTSSHDKQMLFCVCSGMVASLLFNVVLIPHFKQDGAAAANVLSEVIVTAGYYYFVRKQYDLDLKVRPIVCALLSSLIFIPVVYFTRIFFYERDVFILLVSIPVNFLFYSFFQHYVFKNIIIEEGLNVIKQKLKFQNK
ncbi:Membrane protein involved in the export of O-antigen, teichoic acid lipoteichoic acid [Arcticibacter svalbardensis MN12-7]|uniref:Membrane protein involved in the export of O-antigen, teichoic acid lipoteichoic acid n=1 Tax=Arcticibacter svalbardensis MN12-7 TaxID=1150600 RepID=R9GQL5_9SPHI|nr:flippase [Arcticibacter svalbardensis]EOR94021.1 Membrane protein involved in the export of O-antigen, teichoic acid lipoteichoic acid [Arcticibacter svalbardensis MN12-7]